ncbi:conjugal transfer protein [Enterococcus casseliflavus]|uniref:conjugal transfer protein n=1 Tax=Enterococcus casseliflavus TaxID=37734 RepID=UPI000E47E7D3|nr:conjugal transfer protein [Enterococcus casseliflavus]RHH53645.1 conjugal transfer protein [Enterococcus casseliflavus]
MKKIKSYTNIWNVEKVLYAINDVKLPFPVTFSQMAWLVGSLLTVMFLGDLPPLSFLHGVLLKYVGIPVGLTWFMSQKTFDGKRPYRFIQTVIQYVLRSKLTFGGKAVQFKKQKMTQETTVVRSESR